jgi:hypothetical protein
MSTNSKPYLLFKSCAIFSKKRRKISVFCFFNTNKMEKFETDINYKIAFLVLLNHIRVNTDENDNEELKNIKTAIETINYDKNYDYNNDILNKLHSYILYICDQDGFNDKDFEIF